MFPFLSARWRFSVHLPPYLSFCPLFFNKGGSLFDRQAFNAFVVKLFDETFGTKFIRDSFRTINDLFPRHNGEVSIQSFFEFSLDNSRFDVFDHSSNPYFIDHVYNLLSFIFQDVDSLLNLPLSTIFKCYA